MTTHRIKTDQARGQTSYPGRQLPAKVYQNGLGAGDEFTLLSIPEDQGGPFHGMLYGVYAHADHPGVQFEIWPSSMEEIA